VTLAAQARRRSCGGPARAAAYSVARAAVPVPPRHPQPARRAGRALSGAAACVALALAAAGCGSDGEEAIVEALGSRTVTVQVPPSPQSTVPAAPQALPEVPDGDGPEPAAATTVEGAPDRGERPAGRRPAAPAAAARPPRPTVHVTRATALRSRPGGPAIGRVSPRTEFGSPTVLAVVRHRGPWLGVLSAALPNGRIGWISARARLEVHRNAWSVTASLRRRVVVVRRAGRVVDRFPVAIGSPGSPTPTGRFAVTDKLTTGSETSPYGCCILALTGHQTKTPQGWGGGDRLAIHGTNLPSTIGHEASLGCLRAPAAAIRRAVATVPLGTLVTIKA